MRKVTVLFGHGSVMTKLKLSYVWAGLISCALHLCEIDDSNL